jgi:hypothetical protein
MAPAGAGPGRAARYDPCCYLLQSRAMDLMDIGLGLAPAAGTPYSAGVQRIAAARVFLCGIKQVRTPSPPRPPPFHRGGGGGLVGPMAIVQA